MKKSDTFWRQFRSFAGIPPVACLAFAWSWLASPAIGQNYVVSSTELRDIDYYTYWTVQLDLASGGKVTAGFVLDDTLYLVTDKGDIHAVHAGAGLPRWSRALTESVYSIFAPTHFEHDGVQLGVYSTSTRIIILDRYSGATVEDMPLSLGMAGPASATSDMVFFGSNDGHVYAMIWNDLRTTSAVQKWRVMTGGPVTSHIALVNDDNDIVFATQRGSVFSCTSDEKILNWQFDTTGTIFGDIQVNDSAVYVAGTDRMLYRLSTATGDLEWRLRYPEPLDQGPIAMDRTVFQYCEGLGITAVDTRSGEMLWKREAATQVLAGDLDSVFMLESGNRLVKVNGKSGETDASIQISDRTIGVTNPDGGAIYLVSPFGYVVCAQPLDTPRLSPESLAMARREVRAQPRTETEAAEPEAPITHESPVNRDDPLRSTTNITPLAADKDTDD